MSAMCVCVCVSVCVWVCVCVCVCVGLFMCVGLSAIISVCIYLDTLVDVSVLQLHEARGDGRDVRLLVRERHAARALQINTIYLLIYTIDKTKIQVARTRATSEDN